ncbi:MAG TPA: glycosyltransferase family 39 protein, partial [Anaerolineae bacterium]|nr:glycosyltransferase family 39 protein [Anaerolineae bacterium]
VAGRSEFSLRFFSTAWGLVAVALTYRLGRRLLLNRWVAAAAALLAAVSAYLVWYAQEGKMYSLVVLLALASTECYVSALRGGGRARWLAYVLVTTAAFYVHLVAALLVAAHALAFAIVPRAVRGARWRGWLASMAALTLPYVPLLAWQVPMLRAQAETGYSAVAPGDMIHSLLTSYSLGVMPPASPWWLVPFVAAFLAPLLWRGESDAPRFSRGLLATWAILPVLIFGLVNLMRPMYTARYLIFVLPAFFLLIAAGIGTLARRSRPLAAALLVVVIALNVRGLWVQARTPLKSDLRGATRYVTERLQPGELVLFQIPYGRYSFEYYAEIERPHPAAAISEDGAGSSAPGGPVWRALIPVAVRHVPLVWAEGLYTNAGMTPEEVDRLMAGQVAGHQAVWLVASEVELWDERGLVEAWLAEHGELTDRRDLVRVSVYRYALGE